MENSGTITVADLLIGEIGKVVAVNGDGPMTRRLLEMGIVPGVEVEKIKFAPFGDPIQIRVGRYQLALRKSEARTIEIAR